MVSFCEAKHHQKLKYWIFKIYKGIWHFLKLALAFENPQYIDFWRRLALHKIDLQKCPPVRRTYHKNIWTRHIYLLDVHAMPIHWI